MYLFYSVAMVISHLANTAHCINQNQDRKQITQSNRVIEEKLMEGQLIKVWARLRQSRTSGLAISECGYQFSVNWAGG